MHQVETSPFFIALPLLNATTNLFKQKHHQVKAPKKRLRKRARQLTDEDLVFAMLMRNEKKKGAARGTRRGAGEQAGNNRRPERVHSSPQRARAAPRAPFMSPISLLGKCLGWHLQRQLHVRARLLPQGRHCLTEPHILDTQTPKHPNTTTTDGGAGDRARISITNYRT